ncbi:non-ribosomal peptide synthetase [Pseudomonas promysalinigenes]|uniref:Amino acid adenylation protein n=1 Tax=Pseudomonas putida TaxID=303 RepID=G8AA88_PSEPU|nr:non-ribosomal peptide synthetase [Pseudomonas promysalinigenes]ADQ74618.1 amino acid adenylation protein [Pseudomonas putida]QXI32361.1 non-ribosomal peptide synthetase [Pseudomonas promysalinigenes]
MSNDYEAGRDLSDYLRTQARRTPLALALVSACWRLTYNDLDTRVERLAAELVAILGSGPRCVGVQVNDRGLGVVGMLAVLRAGMVYIPLDTSLPWARRAFMIEDSQMACVLIDADADAALLASGVRRFWRIDRTSTAPFDPCPSPHFDAHAPAYLLYTSGSTGQPKGVEMTRRALVNLIDYQLESAGAFAQPLKTLLFASVGFDVSVQEVLSAVVSGSEMHLVDADVRQDLSRLYRFLGDNGVQRCFLPYSVLQTLAIEHERQRGETLCLRQVVSAGEALQLTPQIISWLQACGCVLVNHYGPTETHVVTSYTSERPLSEWPVRVPIGLPIANVRAFILDEQLRPVADGEEGELCLAGPCLANGYFQRDEETAKRFPTWCSPQGESLRLYRTGDRVVRGEEGLLRYHGRLDTQVKLNGHRVELAEIEACLKKDPAVREAIVLAHALSENVDGRMLVAFLLYQDSTEGQQAALERLAPWVEQLPAFMRPQRAYVLERLPLTTNGKVDQRALAAMVEASAGVVAQLSDAQARVAAIFSRLLKVSVTGPHMNFFESGGNSLLATRFVQLVERELGVQLDMSVFLQQPTIARVAHFL